MAAGRDALADDGVAFACIGSDRSTGDALGPIVGDWLLTLGMPAQRVVGTLESPLHAMNVGARADELDRPLLIAIDAALGPPETVGSIDVRRSGLSPGASVGKRLDSIGHLSIVATVNSSAAGAEAVALQCTRLFVVSRLAETIATACSWATSMRAATPALGRVA